MITLEDFFTLAEMKNGLSDIVRVEELLRVVQDVNDGFANNSGDAIRQWLTVASTLAATQSVECLDHFVQLDGLCFLDKWLQEALDSNADTSRNNVQELIDTLLMSLERLSIDNEKLTASGIAMNVQRLLGHENVEIIKKASLLCDKWNLVAEHATTCYKLEQGGGASRDDQPTSPIEEKAADKGFHETNPTAISPSKEEDGKVQTIRNENMAAQCHHAESPHNSLSVKDIPVSDQTLPSVSLNSDDVKEVLGGTNSSATLLVSGSVHEFSSVTEKSYVSADAGLGSTSACVKPGDREGDADNQCHTVSKDISESVKEVNTVAEKALYLSTPRDTLDNSPSSAAFVSEALLVGAVQPIMPCNLDSEITESSATKVVELQPEDRALDTVIAKFSTVMDFEPLAAANNTPQEQCNIAATSCVANSPQFSSPRNDSDYLGGLHKHHSWEMDFKSKKGNAITGESSLKSVGANATEGHKSELEYMFIDDALEVARQVAIEVEREVVDYREAFCSSPEANFEEDAGVNSSDSEEDKKDHDVTDEAGEHSSSSEKDNSLGNSSSKKGSEVTQNVNSDLENLDQDLQSKKFDTPAQESVGKSDTDGCGLDLNADVVNEEHLCINPESNVPANVSAPVAVVASSRGAPVLTAALQFEGGMGWKGTAATSAFRLASPRRTSESEMTTSIPKQKRTFLDIDLNVAESEDEVVVGQLLVKQMPSTLPSGDSSTEVSSRRADKLKLDLNRLGDEDASAYPTLHFKLHQNREHSLSSASSSSSRNPSMRDFNLNDNPSFLDVGASHNFDKSTKTSSSNGNDSVITIMGSKMVVERKDFGNQAQQLFPTNGVNMHLAVAGPLMPYAQMPPPVYGFAGQPSGPTMPAPQAFLSAGSFPYVDARGQTIMPQVTGASGYNGPAPNRPPFFMNAPVTTSIPVVYGSAHLGIDMNAGMTPFDMGAKGANFKQFLLQGQNNLLEDQTKAVPQSSSSVLPSKRKEPDSGWESFSYGYKQMT